jgi:cold shock CspA family protein
MIVGTITRIRSEEYGFIQPDDSSDDCFFHVRDFLREGLPEPKVGDRIGFDPVETPKGRKISNPRYE